MQNKTKNLKRNSQLIQIGFLLILAGLFFVGYQFFYAHKIKAQQTMNQKIFEATKTDEKKEQAEIETKNVTGNNGATSHNTTKEKIAYQYIGMLSISKINLKQGFVDKNDPGNNIEENVTILPSSSYPDQEKGNLILAAHSGTGGIAYFNRLYQLKESDTIDVEYKNMRYTYEIVKIYEQEKTGKVDIYRDINKSTITLITCTNNNDKTQTIYIGNLISKTAA